MSMAKPQLRIVARMLPDQPCSGRAPKSRLHIIAMLTLQHPEPHVSVDLSTIEDYPLCLHACAQVIITAMLWGAGTALGEVPPYLLSYSAAVAGKKSEALAEIEEVSWAMIATAFGHAFRCS